MKLINAIKIAFHLTFDAGFTQSLNEWISQPTVKIESNDIEIDNINFRLEYDESTTASACGFKILSDVISFPYKAGKLVKNEAGDFVPEASPKSPLIKYLYKPNGQQFWAEFLEYHLTNLFVSGESFTVPQRTKGETHEKAPENLLALNESEISVDESDINGLNKLFKWNKKSISFQPDEIGFHRWAVKANNMNRGTGPMQSAMWPILVASKGQKWAAALFLKMGMPLVQIFYGNQPEAWDQIANDPNQQNNLIVQWMRNYSGTKNTGNPYVGVAEVKALSITPEMAGLLDTKENAEGDIARAFGVNPLLIGDTDKASYSNIVEIQKNMKIRHSLFIADRLLTGINRLLQKWFPDDLIFIDLQEIPELKEDAKLLAEISAILVNSGIISPNEARTDNNREDGTPDGDKRIIPGTMAPLSNATGQGNHGEFEDVE